MKNYSDLISKAESVFKSSYRKYIDTWIRNASTNEVKGLKVIYAIVKHRGSKRFRVDNKEKKFDLEQAAEDIRRRTMQSYYNSQYSTASPQRIHESEILKYKKLSELHYSQPLREDSLNFLEKWLQLGDDPKFKDLLVLCLQGFHSVAKINENLPVTNNQDSFYWFSKEERARSKNPSSSFTSTVNDFFPKQKTKSISINESIDIPSRSFYEPKYYQERMKRKMMGSGNFINWVYDKNSSIYQNYFAGKVNKNPAQVAKPANSSTVIRVLPISNVNR
jgi:hypothetical protein